MKRILNQTSKRNGYSGWCLETTGYYGESILIKWTFCTTRKECRELMTELEPRDLSANGLEPVKVIIDLRKK